MREKIEGTPIYVILADHDTDWMMQVAQDISAHHQVKVVGFAQDGETLVDRVINMMADVVLMNYLIPDVSASDIAKQLADKAPEVSVFAVSDSLSLQLEEMAKSSGVVKIYDKNNLDINVVVEEIGAHVDRLRRQQSEAVRKHAESLEAIEESVRAISQTVIVTYNVKGGVGKTTIATNLAAAIKMSPYLKGIRVCLVDFDCGGANVATNCHLDEVDVVNRNLISWERVPENLTSAEVDELLIKGPHGLMVAAAPINQAAFERVTIELEEKIITTLKKHFPIIVIDGAPNIAAPIDVAFEHSTHILMIANAEGQSVKQLARTMQLLLPDPEYPNKPDMSYILDKMFLVLNHAQPPGKWDLKKTEIAEIIGKPIYAEIPYDEAVKQALHGSSPKMAVEVTPDSNFAMAIKSLANDICGAYPGRKAKKSSLLSRLFKKGR